MFKKSHVEYSVTNCNPKLFDDKVPKHSAVVGRVYDDKYMRISDECLEIKRYHIFPYHKSRKIDWKDVEWVRTAREHGVRRTDVEDWGHALTAKIVWNDKWRTSVGSKKTILKPVSKNEILDTNIIVSVKGSRYKCGIYTPDPSVVIPMIQFYTRKHMYNHYHEAP